MGSHGSSSRSAGTASSPTPQAPDRRGPVPRGAGDRPPHRRARRAGPRRRGDPRQRPAGRVHPACARSSRATSCTRSRSTCAAPTRRGRSATSSSRTSSTTCSSVGSTAASHRRHPGRGRSRRPVLRAADQADRQLHDRRGGRTAPRGGRLGRRRGRATVAGAASSPHRVRCGSWRSTRSATCSVRGFVVIGVGGGGIPVGRTATAPARGAAVIDKDLAAALLAASWARPAPHLHRRRAGRPALRHPRPGVGRPPDARRGARYLAEGIALRPGSMAPKIEAVIDFLDRGGEEAIITDPAAPREALAGRAGTRITH
jgi:hypothetical protein